MREALTRDERLARAFASANDRLRDYVEQRIAKDAMDIARLYRSSRSTLIDRLRHVYVQFLGDEPSFMKARQAGAGPALDLQIEMTLRDLSDSLGRHAVSRVEGMLTAQPAKVLSRFRRLGVPIAELPVTARSVLNELTTSVIGGGTFFDRSFHLTDTLRRNVVGGVRQSLLQGETFDELRNRLLKSFGVDKLDEPSGTAYGSVQHYRNEARREWALLMRQQSRLSPSETMEVWWAVLDDATTPGCAVRHGYPIRDGDNMPRHINCFVPETEIQGQLLAATRMLYTGYMRKIKTRLGHCITVTANHPVVTSMGIKPAKLLHKSEYLLAYDTRDEQRPSSQLNPVLFPNDKEYRPAMIAEVFETFLKAGTLRFSGRTSGDFDGDAKLGQGEIEIVTIDRKLSNASNFTPSEDLERLAFKASQLAQGFHAGQGNTLPMTLTIPSASHSLMHRIQIGLQVAAKSPAELRRVGLTTNLDVMLAEALTEDATTDCKVLANLRCRLPGLIQFDEIVEILDFDFSGHVYDLQSATGVIVANNLLMGQCRCTPAIFPADTDLDPFKAEAMAWLQDNGYTRRRALAMETMREETHSHFAGDVSGPHSHKDDKASAEYVSGIRKAVQSTPEKQRDDVDYWVGWRSDPDNDAETFAMMEHVEQASSRQAMMDTLRSNNVWMTNPDVANREWAAAKALGGNSVRPKVTEDVTLTDSEIDAYRARMKFIQDQVRKEHGDEIEVYRGLKGKQAKDLKSDDRPRDFKVRGLASFTMSRHRAADFAGSTGVVMKVRIKVSDIFNMPHEYGARGIQRFTDDAEEVVVLNTGAMRTGTLTEAMREETHSHFAGDKSGPHSHKDGTSDPEAMVKDAGGIYNGIQHVPTMGGKPERNYLVFTDDETGSTGMIPLDDATSEKVAVHLKNIRRRFAKEAWWWGESEIKTAYDTMNLDALDEHVYRSVPWREVPAVVSGANRGTWHASLSHVKNAALPDHVMLFAPQKTYANPRTYKLATVDSTLVPLVPKRGRWIPLTRGMALDSPNVTTFDRPRVRFPLDIIQRWPQLRSVTFPVHSDEYTAAVLSPERATMLTLGTLDPGEIPGDWKVSPAFDALCRDLLTYPTHQDPYFATMGDEGVELIVHLQSGRVVYSPQEFPADLLAPYTRVAAVAMTQEGLIWTVRPKGKSIYVLPGGHLEPGEKPSEAAARELKEETGVGGQIERELGRLYRPWSTTIVYVVRPFGVRVPVATPDENDDVALIQLDQLVGDERLFLERHGITGKPIEVREGTHGHFAGDKSGLHD